jgi:ribosomal protein L23
VKGIFCDNAALDAIKVKLCSLFHFQVELIDFIVRKKQQKKRLLIGNGQTVDIKKCLG